MGGGGEELAAASVTNDYISAGIIDSLGQIEAAEVGSLTATAGTAKGGVIDAFGKAETPEVPGGTFGVGNTSDGTSATTDLGGGFGNA